MTADCVVDDNKRLKAFAYCWADLLLEVDGDWVISFAAGATDVILEAPSAAIVGRRLDHFTAIGQRKVLALLAAEVGQNGRVNDVPLVLQPKPGRTIQVMVGAHRVSRQGNLFLSCRVVTRKAEGGAMRRSEQTGLLDAPSFSAAAARQIKSGGAGRLTLLDIPAMAQAESRLGSLTYDALLRELGSQLRLLSADGDSATQLGDGRFGLLLAGEGDPEKLRTTIHGIMASANLDGGGTDAIGTEMLSLDDLRSASEDDLARSLLYGLTRFRDQSDGVSLSALAENLDQVFRRSVLDMCRLKAVASRRGFEMVYQPIVDLRTGDIHHFEALCRFDRDQSPFELVRFAEETGAAPELDLAVLGKVLERVRRMPVNGNGNRKRIAVNVSGASITDARFMAEAEKLLRDCATAGDRILFEITESARINDLLQANSAIQRLRQWGFPVCLDDFGAGTASFQYLSLIDVDIVKLDGSTIRNARISPRGGAFLSALTEFCKRLGTEVVAEHIDCPDLMDFCIQSGCQLGQGYLFGRPSAEFSDFRSLPYAGRAARHSALYPGSSLAARPYAPGGEAIPLAEIAPCGGWTSAGIP